MALTLIVGIGAVPRVLSYDYGLPYMEYVDELRIYMFAQVKRGLYNRPDYGSGYPPGFVKIQEVAQNLLEESGIYGPAATIKVLRQVAVVTNLIGIVLAAMLARMAGGDFAALVAASVWALSPTMIRESVHAIGESFGYTLMVLNVMLATCALIDSKRWYLLVGSLLLGLIQFVFDYRLILALIPGGSVLLYYALRGRQFTRWQWLLLAGCALLAAALLMLIVYQVLPARLWNRRVIPAIYNMTDFQVIALYFQSVAGYLNARAFWGILLLGIAAYVWALRRKLPRVNRLVLALPALMFVVLPWITSAVRLYAMDTIYPLPRHLLPAAAVAVVLMGAAVAQVIAVLPNRLTKGFFLVGFLAFALLPQIPTLERLVEDRRTQNWQVVIRQWADTNVPAGTVIVYNEHKDTFNPLWGGIQGRQWFDWWSTEDILEYSLEEWVGQRGMSYALLPVPQYEALRETPEGQTFLSETLLLREFTRPPKRREPEGIFLRLWRMQHETDVHFGDHIRMTGYDQSAELVHSGDTVDFTFYWNAPTTPDDNYSLFVHLVPEDEYTVLAQADGSPAVPERLTLSWDEPTETLISPPFTLTIPPDLAPGNYRVVIGLYNFSTGVRLPVADSDLGDAYLLTTLHVDAQSE